MIGLLGCLFALVAVYSAARKSLGHGVSMLFGVGYFYGIFRGRFPDGVSHFVFDVAMIALYAARFTGTTGAVGPGARSVQRWFYVLAAWPLLVILESPFLDAQPIIVQIVGLRAAILMVPMLVLGARLTLEDFDRFSRTICWLNIAALVLGLLEYRFGVERFIPENDVTSLVFLSNDVGSEGAYRIPSCFTSGHGYGGTMFMTMPYVVHAYLRAGAHRRSSLMPLGAILATVIGVFLSGARTPVVQTVASFAIVVLTVRLPFRMYAGMGIVSAAVAVVVNAEERLQRFATLQDTEMVRARIGNTGNMDLFDAMLQYPFGAGLASASGTSIPFFLRSVARPQIYFENELGRVVLEQGVPGLALWVLFAGYCFIRGWTPGILPAVTHRFVWANTFALWALTFLGTGLFTAIPGTVLTMMQMGLLAAGAQAMASPTAAARERRRDEARVIAVRAALARAGIQAGPSQRG